MSPWPAQAGSEHIAGSSSHPKSRDMRRAEAKAKSPAAWADEARGNKSLWVSREQPEMGASPEPQRISAF